MLRNSNPEEIGIGASIQEAPLPPPPGMRVRTGRFESLRS